MKEDGTIDEFHYQSTYHGWRSNSIQAKVWCPFCGSKVLVTMYEDDDGWGNPAGVYEVLLLHRDPKHSDLHSSYATIRFPAIPKYTERFEIKEAQRHHEMRSKTP